MARMRFQRKRHPSSASPRIALAGLLRPPRLRSAEEGHVTWFELFFDLVFVVAVAQLAHELELHPTGEGFARFALLFVPVWWAWVVYTFYADRFDTDDLAYRLFMVLGMLAVVVLAVNLHGAAGSGDGAFVAAYLAVRAIPVLLYLRAGRSVPIARSIARRLTAGSLIAAALWLGSLALPDTARYAVWIAALALELGLPILSARTLRTVPLNSSHIPERFGLFTIIVLGESVLAVASGLAGTEWGAASIVVASAGFLLACSLWWTYFEFADTATIAQGFLARQVYVYGHLPATAGLTAVGAGILLAVGHASDDALSGGARWALCGGIVVFLASLAAIALPTAGGLERWVSRMWPDAVVVAAFVVLAAFGQGVAPPLLVTVVLVAMIALAAFKLVRAGTPPAVSP